MCFRVEYDLSEKNKVRKTKQKIQILESFCLQIHIKSATISSSKVGC